MEKELGFKIFVGPVLGFWPVEEWNFMKKAQDVVKGFDVFKINMPVPKKKKILHCSQHYDFFATFDEFSIRYPENKNFRIFESTTVKFWTRSNQETIGG